MNRRGFAPIVLLLILGALTGVILLGSTQISKVPDLLKQISPNSISTQVSTFISPATPQPTSTPTPTPTPIPTGSFKSVVKGGYYFRAIGNANVTLKNSSFSKSAVSNSDGTFTISDVPIGAYDLLTSHPEYTFSVYKITIQKGDNSYPNISGYLTNPKPTLVNGQIYSDTNGNNTKDGGENGLKLWLELYFNSGNGNWTLKENIDSDDQGNFSSSIVQTGKYQLRPVGKTFFRQPGPVEFMVDGYGGTKSYSFGYYPQVSESGFKIYVFNDKNENGSQDTGEEFVQYQYAKISYLTGNLTGPRGNTWNLAIPPDGQEETNLSYGQYRVELIPESSSWETWFKITKREATVFLETGSGTQTVLLGAHKLY